MVNRFKVGDTVRLLRSDFHYEVRKERCSAPDGALGIVLDDSVAPYVEFEGYGIGCFGESKLELVERFNKEPEEAGVIVGENHERN